MFEKISTGYQSHSAESKCHVLPAFLPRSKEIENDGKASPGKASASCPHASRVHHSESRKKLILNPLKHERHKTVDEGVRIKLDLRTLYWYRHGNRKNWSLITDYR